MKQLKINKTQLNGKNPSIPLPNKDKKKAITHRLRGRFMTHFTKINDFLLYPTILVSFLLSATPVFSEEKTTTNLITNGTFESGNSNGWTKTGDVVVLNDCCGSNYDLEFGDSGSIDIPHNKHHHSIDARQWHLSELKCPSTEWGMWGRTMLGWTRWSRQLYD